MSRLKLFVVVVFTFVMTCRSVHAQKNSDSLLLSLKAVVDREKEFTNDKLKRIKHYKELLVSSATGNDEQRFELLRKLSDEYKSFIYDSAFTYLKKLQSVSYRLHDTVKIAYCKLQMGFIFLSSGMFKETLDSLQRLKVNGLPAS